MDKEFAESYKTAEWQRKKYEILKRDNFTCQLCGNSTEVMEVHHITYKNCRGKAYNALNGELITLCRLCHRGDEGDHRHFGAGRYELRPGKFRPTIRDYGTRSTGRCYSSSEALAEHRQGMFWSYGIHGIAQHLEVVGQRDFKKIFSDCDAVLQSPNLDESKTNAAIDRILTLSGVKMPKLKLDMSFFEKSKTTERRK